MCNNEASLIFSIPKMKIGVPKIGYFRYSGPINTIIGALSMCAPVSLGKAWAMGGFYSVFGLDLGVQ